MHEIAKNVKVWSRESTRSVWEWTRRSTAERPEWWETSKKVTYPAEKMSTETVVRLLPGLAAFLSSSGATQPESGHRACHRIASTNSAFDKHKHGRYVECITCRVWHRAEKSVKMGNIFDVAVPAVPTFSVWNDILLSAPWSCLQSPKSDIIAR